MRIQTSPLDGYVTFQDGSGGAFTGVVNDKAVTFTTVFKRPRTSRRDEYCRLHRHARRRENDQGPRDPSLHGTGHVHAWRGTFRGDAALTRDARNLYLKCLIAKAFPEPDFR